MDLGIYKLADNKHVAAIVLTENISEFIKSFINNVPAYTLFLIILFLVVLIGLISFLFIRYAIKKRQLEQIINDKNKELLREKENSEQLLARVLPKVTVEELQKTGRAKTKRYKMATVLFCDIEGFTRIAEQMNPEALVDKLDRFYFQFDTVVGRYNIEKIKTIGDAYMCAGGIPVQNHTNPVEVILAALEMLQYLRGMKRAGESIIWDIRIGIHTGPVIAGVVGQKRLNYDIWGDTVNTASRMESSGEAGLINISENTFQLVKEFFDCQFRGRMPVKYKGNIKMYFIKSIHHGLHDETNPFQPNKAFWINLQLLRLNDLEAEVFDILETHVPSTYTFHNIKHTLDLYTKTELYANAEELSPEDILILRTAGLLSDINYFEKRKLLTTDIISTISLLNKFKYTENQILIVYSLFECTSRPFKPENALEEVFLDAEYDYLGRMDCVDVYDDLLKEYKNENPILLVENWWKEQIEFLRKHQFYTESAQKLRDVSGEDQIKKLQKKILMVK